MCNNIPSARNCGIQHLLFAISVCAFMALSSRVFADSISVSANTMTVLEGQEGDLLWTIKALSPWVEITAVGRNIGFVFAGGDLDDQVTGHSMREVPSALPWSLPNVGDHASFRTHFYTADNVMDKVSDKGVWAMTVDVTYKLSGGAETTMTGFTYVTVADPPAPVPLPASAWMGLLLMGGLAGVNVARRTVRRPDQQLLPLN